MDIKLKADFLRLWKSFFNDAELPIIFYYTSQPGGAKQVPPPSAHQCIIGVLLLVRNGTSALPMKKWAGMIEDMGKSFLVAKSLGKVQKRIGERQPA
jgi:hypothetical protein